MFGIRRKMKMEFPEDWQFYMRRKGDRDNAMTVNLALHAIAPIASLNVLYQITVPLHEPSEAGLMVASEAPKVDGWRNYLSNDKLAAVNALAVAQWTGNGTTHFDLYAGQSTEVEKVIRQAFTLSRSDYNFQIGKREDAQWSYYLLELYPDAQGLKQIEDYKAASIEIARADAMGRAIVRNLADQGDDHAIVRTVDFTFFFPAIDTAQDFATGSQQLGFSLGRPIESGGNSAEVTVNLSIDLPIDYNAIHGRERILIQRALKMGGRYDGWGSFVCP
jgi:regulator of RNase E activity RraB